MTREVQTQQIVWNNITIEIRYCEAWLSSHIEGYNTAHLEIRAIDPQQAKLPMTETGYRSHFCPHADIMKQDGPVGFVTAWLEHEAQSKAWLDYIDLSRQGSLF